MFFRIDEAVNSFFAAPAPSIACLLRQAIVCDISTLDRTTAAVSNLIGSNSETVKPSIHASRRLTEEEDGHRRISSVAAQAKKRQIRAHQLSAAKPRMSIGALPSPERVALCPRL